MHADRKLVHQYDWIERSPLTIQYELGVAFPLGAEAYLYFCVYANFRLLRSCLRLTQRTIHNILAGGYRFSFFLVWVFPAGHSAEHVIKPPALETPGLQRTRNTKRTRGTGACRVREEPGIREEPEIREEPTDSGIPVSY